MKVTGFSFIRNAQIYDYPIVEAITSILPLCDDFVVAVGKSDDNTLDLIRSIAPEKIRIVETVWDDSLREGGQVLAIETNKAFQAIAAETDWAIYIQGDEVIHEKYLPEIRKAMQANLNNSEIDGLLLNYLHFYGSYDYVGAASRWYRREIRVVRNNKKIYSYRDAQGFRKNDNEKLRVKLIDAYVYHYGWVKEPAAMQRKQENFNKYWHDDAWVDKNIAKSDAFDYSQVDALKKFDGTHPQVMHERIAQKNWKFDHDLSYNNYKTKDKIKFFIEKVTGYRIGEYKNYKIV
ncbi:hypothetical protein SAMN05421780_107152 [Flexibacter flexilis DSM 6793]|uniref:Glycosyl transferase family 2 n=1 Tax=Flexibacter flexilis DSM 6793 TaxID=927664 RepID=A0A1I1KQT6_9BACT|nr:glycosyl transferase [Flexibacter flexilis]SFC62642.1 hypothetical protein SAMN05421780_107152 [Flexibacter flexilis DSM 6793]